MNAYLSTRKGLDWSRYYIINVLGVGFYDNGVIKIGKKTPVTSTLCYADFKPFGCHILIERSSSAVLRKPLKY